MATKHLLANRFTTLAQQLELRASQLFMAQVPDAGRSLFASTDIEAGTVIHMERPMLSAPSPLAIQTTCMSCLRPLTTQSIGDTHKLVGGGAVCLRDDQVCHDHPSSTQTWVEYLIPDSDEFSLMSILRNESTRKGISTNLNALNLSTFFTACASTNEKFPIHAAQLACMTLDHHDHEPTKNVHNLKNSIVQGNPVWSLSDLCFAKIEPPLPNEWIRMHELLLTLLPTDSAHMFDIQWYSWVLSRLHLNVFRVDLVPPLHCLMPDDPSALLRAASAAVMPDSAPSPGSTATYLPGSAVYLLGSMFNHSCEPNVNVQFPINDSTISFVAATDIAKNTELTVSYIDQDSSFSVRQHQLKYGYGFECQCPKCKDEH